MGSKISIAVLASGRGSNFQAIINGIAKGEVNADIKVLITNNPEAQAIERAKKAKIPIEIIDEKKSGMREQLDLEIKKTLDKYNVDLVVLAGYMKLIKSKELLQAYRNRIINIHPSLLPAFQGLHAQKQAFDYGAKVSGLTIHFLDEQLDHGPIIYQEAVDISDCKDEEEAAEKILNREHKAYKKVIDSFSKGKYVIEGRRAKFVPY
ncbi:phosphoribosylglycinamide formyltransferase [Candidatus Micrarchaeota archaeon]|nr:phosphoribosylglycinamide formyltransferase [Candidatus Micrarchaeota archaeon]